MDANGNEHAKAGADLCVCGCKYWENDRCIDCNLSIHFLRLSQISESMTEEERAQYGQTNPIRIMFVAGVDEDKSIAFSAN